MSIPKAFFWLLLLMVLIFSGCATPLEKLASEGIVVPEPNGIYVASGSSTDAKYALKVALASAELCCKQQSKRYVVLGMRTNADKGLANKKTADVLDFVSNVPVLGHFLPIDGSELRGEKHVEVKYKCE